MRTLEFVETGVEGSELLLTAASSLLAAVAGAMGSCALDDNPTSIHANRAVVLIAEVVFMSASFFNSGRGLFLRLDFSERGDFPTWLPARQGNRTDVSTFTLRNARSLFHATKVRLLC